MESDNLYRVQEEDLPRLQKLLTVCFAQDPLYHTLIPDDDTRERLLPELFSCDLTKLPLPQMGVWSKKIQAWKPSGISFREKITWIPAGQTSFTRQTAFM